MSRGNTADVELHKVITTFNAQQDVLVAIVKDRTDIKGNVGELYIQQFDPNGAWVQIAYHPPPNEKRVEHKIPIDPPLQSPFEAQLRLTKWKIEAYNKFKVPLIPRVYYFKLPNIFPFVAPAVIMLGALFFTLWGTGSHADWLREWVATNIGSKFTLWAAYFAAAMHQHLVLEPAYMLYLTGKYGTPLVPRLKWVLCNMVVGFGALDAFFECIMYERIRTVYRQTDVGDIGSNVKGVENPFIEAKKLASKKKE
ncbi:uncharacterized protein EHS24_006653 [Apiotrichum porosum]|uniref:DUF2470 domain-containing protein n=1 Tax=Apiotrichum porosum TaxID=105984 RepID=A0A427Y212_9TREE|nr:uncharacterized protein EHS24_006653 [Apiotrichum porosum]RSH85063.1 hypothetical protein EHS24_006653 [Apiotrichum porosum]